MLTQLPLTNVGNLRLPSFPGPLATQAMAMQFQLGETQWWPREKLEALQFAQLGELLRHARRTVPFYRDFFVGAGLEVPDVVDRTFLAKLPVVRRTTLQEHPERFVSDAPPKEHGPVSFSVTSGSTGRPIRFARTPATHAVWSALALRDLMWHPRDWDGKLCAIRWSPRGTAEAPAGQPYPSWGVPTEGIFRTGPGALLNVTSSLADQLAWLRREKPDFLVSFASNLVALTAYAERQGEPLPKLKQLRTVGESVSPETRQRLEAAWGVRVIDCYSCEEAGYLALQCPSGSHYHVQSESVLLEVLDEADQPCPPGVAGRVVLTHLSNFGSPLIRYEIGDYAELGAPCACGRGLPVLTRIHGRSRNRVRLPDGSNIFPYLGKYGEITALTGVRLDQFQFVQRSLTKLEAKLVLERPLTEAEQTSVAKLLRHNFGQHFTEVVFSFPSEIPRGPNGKYEEFKCAIED